MQTEEIVKRIDMDLKERSMTGVLLYMGFLPLIFWVANTFNEQPTLALAFSAVMILISLLRLLVWYGTDTLYSHSPFLWRFLFSALSLCHAAVLSYFFTLCLFDERFAPIMLIGLLVMGGVASAGVMAFTPRRALSLGYLYTLTVPIIFVGFYFQSDTSLAIMLVVFTAFVTLMGIKSTKEYNRSFDIEVMLDEQKKVLEHINKIDGLTHIYNRKHFNSEFEQRWERGIRHNIEEAVILIDIDYFKRFNDEHGHLCGDACLVHVAKVISSIVRRSTDLFARFGGEEFVVLLADCPEQRALDIAERIRAAVEGSPLVFDGKTLAVTASLGLAVMLPTLEAQKETLLVAADDAMYVAKSQGRNQVVANKKAL